LQVVAVDELGKAGAPAADAVTVKAWASPAAPQIDAFTPPAAQPGDMLQAVLRNVANRNVRLVIRWFRNHDLVYEEGSTRADEAPTIAPNGTFTFSLNQETQRGDVWYFHAYADDTQGGVSRMVSSLANPAFGSRVIGGGGGGINQPPSAPTVAV